MATTQTPPPAAQTAQTAQTPPERSEPKIPVQPTTAAPPAVESSPDAKTLAPASERVKDRVPFSGFTKKLDVRTKLPGYVLYWINDEPGRIPTLERHGFEFVNSNEVPEYTTLDGFDQNRDLGSRVSRPTRSTGVDGKPMLMYLMKLPIEFAQQDAAAHNARQAEIDRAISEGSYQVEQDAPGRIYRPDAAGPAVKTSYEYGKFPSGMQDTPTGMKPRGEHTMTGLGKR